MSTPIVVEELEATEAGIGSAEDEEAAVLAAWCPVEPPCIEDESDGCGKQTLESSEREAHLGQRPTRDDGDNDDLGELK